MSLDDTDVSAPADLSVAEHLELVRLLEQARRIAAYLEAENDRLVGLLGADVVEEVPA